MIFGFFVGFIFGIALASFFHISFGFILFLLLITALVYFYEYFVDAEHHKVLIVSTFVLLGVAGGVGRMYVSDFYSNSQLDSFVDKKVVAVGTVVDEPDVRESSTKLVVRISGIDCLPRSELCSTTGVREKVLVSVPIYPDFHYGDRVSLRLQLSEPQNIESDGRVFDYKGYLRVRGIWYTSRFTTIELISSGHGAYIKTLLFTLKHKFTSALENALPEPESSLMTGLLLGTKQSLGKELLAEFQRTGTSHVVVLSGYNIAIVATSIMSLLKFLPKNISFGFGIISIILFTILSGGGASAWRAAIMVLVALFAKKMNRDYKVGRVFGFTVLLMLAPNPLLLVFDPSFQLSVLATIGIIFVSPIIQKYFEKVPEKFGLREVVSSTIATQIVVLPYLIYNTGILSLVSLPVNVLILGTIPITMLFGFLTGAIGLISLYLSFIPALFACVLLLYQLTVVHLGSILPFGVITLPAFSSPVLIIVYAGIFIWLLLLRNK